MASRMRERVLGGILRRSFCTAGLSWTLKEAIFAQPPFHVVQADRFFIPTLRDDRKVVEIFHKSFVLLERDNDGLPFAILIDDKLLVQDWLRNFSSG
jgi:hypothetical protein